VIVGAPTTLVVVRHGETAWNAVGRQQGQLDGTLSERGIEQARVIADALAPERFDALYASDLGRAIETAAIVAERLHLDVIPDPRLRERHLGVMQGLTIAEFAERFPEEHARFASGDPDYVLPEGESARQRYERTVACAEDLAVSHPGEQLLLVAHGGVLNGYFRHAVGLPLETPRAFSLFNASINRFVIEEGRWRLDVWGDVRHLGILGTLDDW
jgi:probable phosphoglycerate mutase